jgi:hypothetical protein
MFSASIFKDRFRQVAPAVIIETFYLAVGYDLEKPAVRSPKVRFSLYIPSAFFKSGLERKTELPSYLRSGSFGFNPTQVEPMPSGVLSNFHFSSAKNLK